MAGELAVEDPWKKLLVLTLDGGGTRGYASLLMLKELMNEVASLEKEFAYPSGNDGQVAVESHRSSFGRSDQESRLEPKFEMSPDTEREPKRPGWKNTRIGSGLSGLQRRPSQASEAINDLTRRRNLTHKELIQEEKKYLPCHYFDYIGGTSTGGLAALMLGRLRMSVDECIDRYPEMAKSIFGDKRHLTLGGMLRDRYDAKNLKKAIQSIVDERLAQDEKAEECGQLASPDDLCKTVLIAKMDGKRDGPYLFRSYDTNDDGNSPHNPGPANTCEIWQAGRATAAAPHYLKHITIDGHEFYDGGVGFNDPSEEVYKDVLMRAKCNYGEPAPISLFLTLGTGTEPTLKQKAKGLLNKAKGRVKNQRLVKRLRMTYRRIVKETATNTEGVAARMRGYAKDRGFKYFKWDGGDEVGALGLDNCKDEAFDKMRKGIKRYMAGETRMNEVREAAKLLVAKRRARFTDEDRWQRFAYCSIFVCVLSDCMRECNTRAEIERHYREEHDDMLTDPEGWRANQGPVMPYLRGPFGHNTNLKK